MQGRLLRLLFDLLEARRLNCFLLIQRKQLLFDWLHLLLDLVHVRLGRRLYENEQEIFEEVFAALAVEANQGGLPFFLDITHIVLDSADPIVELLLLLSQFIHLPLVRVYL